MEIKTSYMDNEFIKKDEACRAGNCQLCSACAERNDEVQRESFAGAGLNSELYGREAEHYYFYFVKNKAS